MIPTDCFSEAARLHANLCCSREGDPELGPSDHQLASVWFQLFHGPTGGETFWKMSVMGSRWDGRNVCLQVAVIAMDTVVAPIPALVRWSGKFKPLNSAVLSRGARARHCMAFQGLAQRNYHNTRATISLQLYS